MTPEQKIKILISLASEALNLADEGWELADAYAGGESENADELGKKIEKLGTKLDQLLEK